MDPRNTKCSLQWWGKHEAMFPTFGFLACQFLSIVGSQIEIERSFSLVDMLTNLRNVVYNKIKT